MHQLKCASCGLTNFANVTACRRCNGALNVAVYQPIQQPAPYRVNPAEYVNRGGKTCPRCGVTNSSS